MMKRSEEYHKYGMLIAKLMRDKITDAEAQQLDDWVLARDENMRLFENLLNDYKQEWARKWFKDAGVSTRGLKWERVEGWYKRDKNVWDFYIVIAVVVLVLIGVYFLIR